MRETLSDLSETELDAVVAFVHALVRRDREVLEAAGAYDRGAEPFMYVDDYDGDGTGVDLAVPPGDPRNWYGGVIRSHDTPGWAYVMVDLYDEQHGDHGRPGENDLSVELDLTTDTHGSVTVAVRDLHVM